jgi:ABC-2 type transport system permease protein
MSTATLPLPASPNSPARLVRIFLTEVRYEFVRAMRTKAYSLSVIGFPVIFYLFFGIMMNRSEHIGGMSVAKNMLAGYAVFATIGSSLFGIGVGLSGDLSAGWLELKRASPMPPLAYLLAKCCTAMGFAIIIATILSIMGIAFGGVHLTFHEYATMIALVIIGSIPFACMGLVLALVAPFNAAPGFANMLYLPMSFLGGLWMPIEIMPTFLQKTAFIWPTYHLKQLVLASFNEGHTGSSMASHWLGLGIFTALMIFLAGFFFQRREQNS